MPIQDLTPAQKKELEDGPSAGTIKKLDTTLAGLLTKAHVSKITQYHIQKSPYGSNLDLFAQIYRDDTQFDNEIPKRFKFNATVGAVAPSGHDMEEMHDETVALRVVWKAARHQVQKNLNAQDVAAQRDRPLYGISDGDRNNLELAWLTLDPSKLPVELKYEGSDGYLGKTYKMMAIGRINHCTSKHTLGTLEHTDKEARTMTDPDGRKVETYEELGTVPHEARLLEHRWMVRRTTTMMCVYGLPHVDKIQCTRRTMDKVYKFINGPSIADRPHNKPNTLQLRHAEDKMWQHIANQLQQGDKSTLEDALNSMLTDTVFWTNHLFSYCDKPNTQSPGSDSPGKGSRLTRLQPGWGKKGDWYGQKGDWYGKKGGGYGKKGDWTGKKGGYGNPKGKGTQKGTGKYGNKGTPKGWYNTGYTDQSDALWQGRKDRSEPTAKHPTGLANCRKYHLHNSCFGGCGRDHSKCPNRKADGTWCNGNHPAWKCTEGHHPN